jgi:hypothetical protein
VADSYYRLRARVRQRSVEIVEAAAEQLGRALNNVAPEKTGRLKDSQTITISDESQDGRVSVNISYPVPYFRTSDLGWEGGLIFPKQSKYLHFYWEDGPWGPRDYRLPYVNHPGWQGTRWYSDLVTPDFWRAALQGAQSRLSS